MIVELPLVDAAEIAAEFRPGGGGTTKATVRRLKERGLVSSGLGRPLRGPGGRVAGAWRVYSALNLDAARAARSKDEAAARAIAEAAMRVERAESTVDFVSRLAHMRDSTTIARLLERALSDDQYFVQALRVLVAQTVAERNRLVHDASSVQLFALVAKVKGDVAELAISGAEHPVALPMQQLESLDSAFPGAALALRFERFGRGQTLIKALPAIKLDDGGDLPIYPYEGGLPDERAPVALVSSLASLPQIRRPRAIPIAGDR